MKNILNRMRKNSNLNDSDQEILNSIEYSEINYRKLVDYIWKYTELDIPYFILKENWDKIVKLGRDSNSLKCYLIRYGEKVGVKLFQEKLKASTNTKEDLIQKFGEEKTREILWRRSACLEAYVYNYGEKEGHRRWEEYCKKRKKTYKSRRGTYTKRNREWYIKKYGEKRVTE